MAHVEHVVFTIDDEGNLSTEMKGVKGPSCVERLNEIHSQLGFVIAERMATSEMYEVPGGGGVRIGGSE